MDDTRALYVIEQLLKGDRKLPAPSFTLEEVEALEFLISKIPKKEPTYYAPRPAIEYEDFLTQKIMTY